MRLLFSGINLGVHAGEILELRGPNGCGKTSLLKILARLASSETGIVEHYGSLHYCGHADAVKPGLSINEQMKFWTSIFGAKTETISPALSFWKLEHLTDLPARLLSAGQQKRLALSRLLLAPRPIWLLDEPFAGLCSEGEYLLATMAEAHCQAGGLIIATAHGHGFANARQLDIHSPVSTPAPVGTPEPVPAKNKPAEQTPPFLPALTAMIKRELILSWSGSAYAPPIFCLGCAALIPLAIGPEASALRDLAPGMIMIILALSGLLSLERLFGDDLEDGTLDTLSCSGHGAELPALAGMIGHWLAVGLPLTALTPIVWLALQGDSSSLSLVVPITLIAGITMFALGTIAAALATGAKRNGVLTTILALPLYWPVMIFAAAAMQSAQNGGEYLPALQLTIASMLFALVISPLAATACLKAALDS